MYNTLHRGQNSTVRNVQLVTELYLIFNKLEVSRLDSRLSVFVIFFVHPNFININIERGAKRKLNGFSIYHKNVKWHLTLPSYDTAQTKPSRQWDVHRPVCHFHFCASKHYTLFLIQQDHFNSLDLQHSRLKVIKKHFMQLNCFDLCVQFSGGSRISRRGSVDPLGGRGPLTWVLFGKNVCENERIWSRKGGGVRPARSP